jgi:HEAT repeat protein
MHALLVATLLLVPPHGGQYMPPSLGHKVPADLTGVLAQPGLGPELRFLPNSWEWWFDFNHEELLRLRERLTGREAQSGAGRWEPVTHELRDRRILPVLVDAARRRRLAVGGLRRELNSRDVRAAAVLAMGRLARAEAVPFIEMVLEDDPDLFVRTQAVLALGFSESPQAVEALIGLYGDESQGEELRSYAAAGLGLIGNAQALDALRSALTEKALSSQGNQLRAATVHAVGLTGEPGLAAALRDLEGSWLFRKEPHLRALTALALGHAADGPSLAMVLELLGDDDNQVRRSAAAGLEAAGGGLDAAAIDRVIELYRRESDVSVRQNLLRALGALRHDASRAFLREELAEVSYELRPHLALGLALDGDPGNALILIETLADQHDETQRAALITALGLLEAEEAGDPLWAMLQQERSPYLRGYLALALGLIAPDQADLAGRVEALVREQASVEVARWSMIALGLLGARGRLEQFAAEAAAMEGIMRRASVLNGLGLTGDAQLIEPLIAIVEDDSQTTYIRTYALQALGELADPRELPPTWRLSSHAELHHDIGFLFELYRVL